MPKRVFGALVVTMLTRTYLRGGDDFPASGFGGIGGMLRYRVDFAAMDYEPGEFDDVDLDDYM